VWEEVKALWGGGRLNVSPRSKIQSMIKNKKKKKKKKKREVGSVGWGGGVLGESPLIVRGGRERNLHRVRTHRENGEQRKI